MNNFQSIYCAAIAAINRVRPESTFQFVESEFNSRFLSNFYSSNPKYLEALITSNKLSFNLPDKIKALNLTIASYSEIEQHLLIFTDLLNSIPVIEKPIRMDTQKPTEKPKAKETTKKLSTPSLDKVLATAGTKKTRFNQNTNTSSLNKPTFTKPLDKHVSSGLKDELLKVGIKKYPHYDCEGCNLCEQAFTTLAITKCSKAHGGNPCNVHALYPHASKTWLSVAHSLKKIKVWNSGFENPLSEKPANAKSTKINAMDVENIPNALSSSADKVTNRGQGQSVKQFIQPHADTVEEREITKQRNTVVWKLKSDSPRDLFELARTRFRNLKRSVPGYTPPSWATGCSKAFYETDSIDDAKYNGRVFESRRKQRNRSQAMKRKQAKRPKH